jgi:hypothetical protein
MTARSPARKESGFGMDNAHLAPVPGFHLLEPADANVGYFAEQRFRHGFRAADSTGLRSAPPSDSADLSTG